MTGSPQEYDQDSSCKGTVCTAVIHCSVELGTERCLSLRNRSERGHTPGLRLEVRGSEILSEAGRMES
jgi:hypothetical protein